MPKAKSDTTSGARQSARSSELLPIRFARLHVRLLISVVFGICVTLLLRLSGYSLSTRLLTGWDSGVLLYLITIYSLVRRNDIARLRVRAREEDEGAIALLLLTFVAALASLAAIMIELGESKHAAGIGAVLRVALGMGTIVLSWLFVHTSFALHYAHEYYGEGRDSVHGGLNFPGQEDPDYWDFLYFSLVIAMTSQVSDVAITSRSLRRLATMHGALSFFLNLGVLALTVNMIANLI
ncbi:MAG: hypothetical protein OJF62_001354 [Pseudolabrys sp.]|jgi:uncharacterized membrane protein|nr:hypothetical protein [Pseudolabrys sp.]